MKFKLFDSQAKAKEVLQHHKPVLVRAGKKEICLVRQHEDLYAFQNECAHMGEALHRGNMNHFGEIVCPLHTYRFSIRSGEESDRRCQSIKTYPVIELSDGIYVDC